MAELTPNTSLDDLMAQRLTGHMDIVFKVLRRIGANVGDLTKNASVRSNSLDPQTKQAQMSAADKKAFELALFNAEAYVAEVERAKQLAAEQKEMLKKFRKGKKLHGLLARLIKFKLALLGAFYFNYQLHKQEDEKIRDYYDRLRHDNEDNAVGKIMTLAEELIAKALSELSDKFGAERLLVATTLVTDQVSRAWDHLAKHGNALTKQVIKNMGQEGKQEMIVTLVTDTVTRDLRADKLGALMAMQPQFAPKPAPSASAVPVPPPAPMFKPLPVGPLSSQQMNQHLDMMLEIKLQNLIKRFMPDNSNIGQRTKVTSHMRNALLNHAAPSDELLARLAGKSVALHRIIDESSDAQIERAAQFMQKPLNSDTPQFAFKSTANPFSIKPRPMQKTTCRQEVDEQSPWQPTRLRRFI